MLCCAVVLSVFSPSALGLHWHPCSLACWALLLSERVYHLDLNLQLCGGRVQLSCRNSTIGWVAETKGVVFSQLEAGRVKITVPAGVASGEGSLPGSLTATHCPHGGKREETPCSLLTMVLVPSWRPSLGTTSEFNYLAVTPPPVVILGVRAST